MFERNDRKLKRRKKTTKYSHIGNGEKKTFSMFLDIKIMILLYDIPLSVYTTDFVFSNKFYACGSVIRVQKKKN